MTIAELKRAVAELSTWKAAVTVSRPGPDMVTKDAGDALVALDNVPAATPEVTAHRDALKGKAHAIMEQAGTLRTDIEGWLSDYDGTMRNLKSDKTTMLVLADQVPGLFGGMKDGALATSIRGQQVINGVAANVSRLTGLARSIKSRASALSKNISSLIGETKDTVNAATGGGVLPKIQKLATLPSRIVGESLANVTAPVSGILKFALVAVGIGAVVWFTLPYVFKRFVGRKTTEATA